MLPQVLFKVGMVSGTVILLFLNQHVFLDKKRIVTEFIHEDWKYIGIAWLATVFVNTAAQFHIDTTFTPILYNIEGSTVAVFQTVTWPPLTWFLSFIYLIVFPAMLIFTYFKLKEYNREQAHRYAFAYGFIGILSTPWFVWFPITVTSHFLPSVQPLLYTLNPIITAGIHSIDTLVKDFPSLHAGLGLISLFYARKTDKKYFYVTSGITLLIFYAIFYLGIHWISDAVFAAILAIITYYISQHVRLPTTRK